jgi:hypothetical protein
MQLRLKPQRVVAQAGNDQLACCDDQTKKTAGSRFVRPKPVFVSGQMTSTLAAGSIRHRPWALCTDEIC